MKINSLSATKILTSCLALFVGVLSASKLQGVEGLEQTDKKVVAFPGDSPLDYGDEPMRYLENDRVKLGLDLSLGGAVTFLEDKANNSGNMINSHDWGRQIQLSYYSGPAPYVGPNGEQPSTSWAGLGWNPIQSGDCGGYRSQVLEFTKESESVAFLRARPMLWPHSGVPAECVFECRYQLTENGFTLDATIVNNRSDKTQYNARAQETPALYTNAPWYKLVSYLGDKPFENEPITTLVDQNDGNGWPWLNYYTPEYWSALVNENNYGIGVYQPYSGVSSSGFHGGDEPKGKDLGDKSIATGYIAPRERTILDWNIRRAYRATFIVGSVDEIRNTVYKLAKRDVVETPNWIFKDDRQNWSYDNAIDEGYPIVDSLKIILESERQAAAKSPIGFWKAANAPVLNIDAVLSADVQDAEAEQTITVSIIPVSPADSVGYLAWSEGNKNVEQDRAEKEKTYPRLSNISVDVPVKFDGQRRTIAVDLTDVQGYDGAMKGIMIFFPKIAGKATIYSVGFSK